MIKGSEKRKADHPIDKIFLDRWSPRAMTGEAVSQEDLMTLFEAARWAPSSYNNQPWRILYARRDTQHWPLFFDLLVEFNQSWAKNAGALVLFISRTHFDFNGEPAVTHSFDTGAAWENLALQGWLKGLVVHGMQGFDYDRARTAKHSGRISSGSSGCHRQAGGSSNTSRRATVEGSAQRSSQP
jgi:nitroreductase